MYYIWDPEFDVIAAAIAKDARAAAAVEEVVVVAAAAASDEPAKLPQEKNNNRNGALNWGIPENQSMMEIISEGGQYTYIKSNPIWEKIAVQLGNTRLGSGYFDHYQDMHQALKSARANMTLCKYVAGDDNSVYFTELVKLLTSGQKLYKAKRWWSISIVELPTCIPDK